MAESNFDISENLPNLVKKILLTFCEVHVSFRQRLDIYGSIHVRSDDSDLTCFILNEHSYKELDSGCVNRTRSGDGDVGLTRYVSSVSGVSSVETITHQTSSSYGSNAEYTGDIGVCGKRKSLMQEENCKNGNKSIYNATDPSTTSRRSLPIVSSATMNNIEIDDVTDETCDVKTNYHDLQETEAWAEADLEAGNISVASTEEQMASCGYIKQENATVVKTEAVNDNDVIDLASDEETYEPNEEYDTSAYDNSSLHLSYTSSSAPISQSELYSQPDWNQFVGNSPVPIARPPPQRMCHFCLKSFTSNIQLRLHIQRYHATPESSNHNWQRRQSASETTVPNSSVSSDKKLTCSICMLSFKSLDGLRCHENSKHSRNKLYSCQFCSQVFFTRQAAYTHRIKFHRLKVRKSEDSF